MKRGIDMETQTDRDLILSAEMTTQTDEIEQYGEETEQCWEVTDECGEETEQYEEETEQYREEYFEEDDEMEQFEEQHQHRFSRRSRLCNKSRYIIAIALKVP